MAYRGWSGLRGLALVGLLLSSTGVAGVAAQQAGAAGTAGVTGVGAANRADSESGAAPGLIDAQGAPVGVQGRPAAPRPVSLEEALALAEGTSEQMTISQAGVLRARGQQLQARSQLFPQLQGTVGYTRTLATEFSALTSSAPDTTAPQNCPDGRFRPNPALPLGQRVDSLEHALECGGGNPFAAFRDLPFGRRNQVNMGLTFSQNVFTGGRILGQIAQANASKSAAEIALNSTRAQLMLDVTQAYYDAALADRLLAIAQGTLTQAQRTLSQVQVARRVGNQPEFELLRAQVAYENQRPVVIQRTAQRDIAFLRLKQLLNLPADQPVALTSTLADSVTPPPLVRLAAAIVPQVGDTATEGRAPVRQAGQALRAQEGALRVARSERIPSLALVSQYGRVAYPEGGMPAWSDFRTNWTLGLSLSVPLFTGGRIHGDQLVAEAGLMEARARLRQTSELAALDTRSAVAQLQAAEASFAASAGTAQQAGRAYQIADVRYREGISTQLELNDSRLMLEQAEANRAQAARDLQIARVRLALLPALPLGAGSATSNASAAAQMGTSGGSQTPALPPSAAPAPPSQGQQASRGGTGAVSASSASINP